MFPQKQRAGSKSLPLVSFQERIECSRYCLSCLDHSLRVKLSAIVLFLLSFHSNNNLWRPAYTVLRVVYSNSKLRQSHLEISAQPPLESCFLSTSRHFQPLTLIPFDGSRQKEFQPRGTLEHMANPNMRMRTKFHVAAKCCAMHACICMHN